MKKTKKAKKKSPFVALNVQVYPQDKKLIEQVAKRDGVKQAQVVRALIRYCIVNDFFGINKINFKK